LPDALLLPRRGCVLPPVGAIAMRLPLPMSG
jgi:hypothetical protein